MARTQLRRPAFAAVLGAFVSLFAADRAGAEDAPVETADGVDACRTFQAKNDKELKSWEKQQPAVPYAYPKEDTVLGSPWGMFLSSVSSSAGLLLATILPHPGAQFRGDAPAAVVSWPWSLPIGPGYACTRRQGLFVVRNFKAHRLMLEPGFASGKRGTGFFVRPGYRFVWHPSEWVVGIGGGVGSTIEVAGQREPFRFSVSPEALLHFGHCCDPSYFTLTFRYDRYFNGTVLDVFGGSLGYTFF